MRRHAALFLVTLVGLHLRVAPEAFSAPASLTTNTVAIRSITVDGRSVDFAPGRELRVSPSAQNLSITFDPDTNTPRKPYRLRCKLDGVDAAWREGNGEMLFAIRFIDAAGDLVSQESFPVRGESPGWSGALETSTLTPRRESIVVPPRAERIWAVISSAGPPATLGLYVVDNLVVSRLENSAPEVLLRSPFGQGRDDPAGNDPPPGWLRDGTLPSMARVVHLGAEGTTRALAMLDEDPSGHAEWHTLKEMAPRVNPGDHLLLEWNELFSMGQADIHETHYPTLPPGSYRFHVESITPLGQPTGIATTLLIRVPPPFWEMPWFWGTVITGLIAMAIAGSRFAATRQARRELLRLEQQRLLEQERLRIARDIHDDLGARVTQISLLSAMAHDNVAFPARARAEFDRVSRMSRDLVSALYETVWAVNPENDNLDALGNFVCQMVNQLCEPAQLRCRLDVQDLPGGVQVSSQIRHNLTLAVKEAVHNIIKHARATELQVRVTWENRQLTISILDNGCGFDPATQTPGNGLNNMRRRLQDIGGRLEIDSQPRRGTTVHLRLALSNKT